MNCKNFGKKPPPNPTEQDEVQEWINASKRLDGAYLIAVSIQHVSTRSATIPTDKIVPFIQELGNVGER